MFCVSPVVAATEAEARAEIDRLTSTGSYIEKQLVGISSNTEIDFKQFDWDEPLPGGPDHQRRAGLAGALHAR